jgi:hypothetical protein
MIKYLLFAAALAFTAPSMHKLSLLKAQQKKKIKPLKEILS